VPTRPSEQRVCSARLPPTEDHGAQSWKGLFGHAMESDQTKSRRIHADDGSGAGTPTGFVVSKVIPSVPSLFTEDSA
jgi:hypothetical protein